MLGRRQSMLLGLAAAALPGVSLPVRAAGMAEVAGVADVGAMPASAMLRAWLAEEGGATERFWARLARQGTPLLELLDEGRALRATFVWRGATTREVQMFWPIRRHDRETFTRLPGTDLWHYSLRLPVDAHLSYQIAPDVPRLPGADRLTQRRAILDVAQADPLNPRRWPHTGEPDVRHVHSVLLGPGAPALPDATPVRPAQRGSLRNVEWRSERLNNSRTVTLYLPALSPAVASHELPTPPQGWPLLLLFDREAWLQKVPTPALLDRLIAEGRLPPMAALLVGHPTPEHRGRELPCNADFADAMALELLPWVRAQAPVATDPQRVVVAGASYGGLASAWLGLRHPRVFGRVLSLSGSFWWSPNAVPGGGAPSLDDRREGEWLTQQFAHAPLGDVSFVLSAGLFERSAPNDGPGILETTRHLRDVLRARGKTVQHREFAGGHDYLAWQRELVEGLALLLPTGTRTRS